MTTIRCKAIIFDNDGVLVNSKHAVEQGWRDWAVLRGLDPDEVAAQAEGRRSQDTVALLAPHLDALAESQKVTEFELDYIDSTRAFPNAPELLAAMQGRPHAVVTSGTADLASARLNAVNLPIPAVFITGDQVANGKPHPEGYRLAAERLGIDPAQCVVIEDSPPGVTAAKAAGATAIGVATTHPAEELAHADYVLPALAGVSLAFEGDDVLVTVRTAE